MKKSIYKKVASPFFPSSHSVINIGATLQANVHLQHYNRYIPSNVNDVLSNEK
jgi:hypothetical protein